MQCGDGSAAYTVSPGTILTPGVQRTFVGWAAQLGWDTDNWSEIVEGSGTAEQFQALLGEDKSRPVVIYCGFVKCGRSHNAAAWAVTQGYQQVYRVPGGIFAWKGAGYPVSAK